MSYRNSDYNETSSSVVSFQELNDPFIETLQLAIDEFKSRSDTHEFKKVLQKIYQKYPHVDLTEFLEMYVNGDYTKEMISRFNLVGYTDHKNILQILKLGLKRKSIQKNAKAREINLTDPKLANRYVYLSKNLNKLKNYMDEMTTYNTLRMVVTLQLYRNDGFSNTKDLTDSITETIIQFDHVLPKSSKKILQLEYQHLKKFIKSILEEMKDESLIEIDNDGKIILERHQLRLKQYIINTIHNQVGITYEKLAEKIRKNLPMMKYMPQAIFLLTLDELISNYQIIKKEGYWKLRPYFDEYFTIDDYRSLTSKSSTNKPRKFFGRRISPSDFIEEIVSLEKGDFEDQDDQVTRIAGMILSRSNMMKHPPNKLDAFDFAVDLSQYEFSFNEQKIIDAMGLVIRSNTVYVKIMINEELMTKTLKNLNTMLHERRRNEQGFVISFIKPNASSRSLLERDKTIQLISKKILKEWCKITPVIPSRRGAVAVIRQGDHKGSIVKIESINYESGRADIMILPDMIIKTQYIGSLEEISLQVDIEKFIEFSNKYFQFLNKLWKISNSDKFKTVISDRLTNSLFLKKNHSIIFSSNKIKLYFEQRSFVSINLNDVLDSNSLKYSIDGLFSCSCLDWEFKNKTKGLCPHLIFALNEIIKKVLTSDVSKTHRNTEEILLKIENMMDVFLNRLRYSTNDLVVECPSCHLTASTLIEVKNLFGYRQMNKIDKFSLRRQSRCMRCRR